jgi:Ca2+-binding EF-hand superfamily protein
MFTECCQTQVRDVLGNGYIPTSCLREILRELDDQLTSDELDMMIEEIDSDGSGTVDFDGKYWKYNCTYY